MPQLINLSDAKDDAGAPHLDAIYARWRPNVGKQCEDQFSDGTLRLIGLFRTLLEGDSPLPTIQAAGTPIFLLTVWTSITAQRSSLPRGSIIGVMRGFMIPRGQKWNLGCALTEKVSQGFLGINRKIIVLTAGRRRFNIWAISE